jgi:plastocyanin
MKLTAMAFALVVLGAALPAEAATYISYANSPGVYWLSDPAPPPLANATVSQAQNAFVPKLLVVPVGTSVHFAAGDRSCSAVFSDSPIAPFTVLQLPATNGVTFSTPGPITIRCRAKPSMRGTIVVVDGHYAVVTRTGGYQIEGVIPGPHTLHVWSRGTKVSSLPVIVR